jgi:uncharacterized protein
MTRLNPPYRYRPPRFFLLAFAFSWIPWLVGARLSAEEATRDLAMLLNLIGLLGPAVAALALIFTSGSGELKTDFRRRVLDFGALRSRYTLALIGIPVAVVLMSIWLSTLWGHSAEQFRWTVELSGLVPMILIGVLLAPVIEELGWRGYGVDALRERMGLLGTSLAFGVLWSLWHAPLVFIQGTYHHELATMDSPVYLANFFVSVVALSTVTNWLYFRLERSIPAAMILHAMVNLMAMGPAAEQFSKVLVTVLYVAITVALVVATRGFASEGPRSFLGAPVRGPVEGDRVLGG